MSDWFGEIYDEIEAVVKSDCAVQDGMSSVIASCARHRPHPDWARFGSLDIDADLERMEKWLRSAFLFAPTDRISGLWFGLFNPIYDGAATADVHLNGSPYDPEDPDWASAAAWWPNRETARSSVLQDIYEISYGPTGTEPDEDMLQNDGEYPLCLAYAGLAVRTLAAQIGPRVLLSGAPRRVLFVGFDSGDPICIGEMTTAGLCFSADSFDWVPPD